MTMDEFYRSELYVEFSRTFELTSELITCKFNIVCDANDAEDEGDLEYAAYLRKNLPEVDDELDNLEKRLNELEKRIHDEFGIRIYDLY